MSQVIEVGSSAGVGGYSIDPTPVSGSPKAVQSGGVFTALQNETEARESADQGLASSVTDLEEDVVAINSDIADLEQDVLAINQEIVANEEAIGVNTSAITTEASNRTAADLLRLKSVTVATYADMLTAATGSQVLIFGVTVDDENMYGQKGAYIYIPSFGIGQIAINFI